MNIPNLESELERIGSDPRLSRGYVCIRVEMTRNQDKIVTEFSAYTDRLGWSGKGSTVEEAISLLPSVKTAAIAELAELDKRRAELLKEIE